MTVESKNKDEEVGNEKGEDAEKVEKQKHESKDEQILVARDIAEYEKRKQIISDIDLIQGPININSLSLVQALKFREIA